MLDGGGGGGGGWSGIGGRTGTRGIGNGGSGRIGRVGCAEGGGGGRGDMTRGGKLRCVITVGERRYSGTRSPRGVGCGARRTGATNRSPKEVKTVLVLSRIGGIGVTFVVIGRLGVEGEAVVGDEMYFGKRSPFRGDSGSRPVIPSNVSCDGFSLRLLTISFCV